MIKIHHKIHKREELRFESEIKEELTKTKDKYKKIGWKCRVLIKSKKKYILIMDRERHLRIKEHPFEDFHPNQGTIKF